MPPQNNQVGTVRITYYHHDQLQTEDQPRTPVFIASSLTVPPWQMLEMTYDANSSTENTLVYVIDFHNVSAGRYQYKFRIGYGGDGGGCGNEEACWVLDEGTEVGWSDPLVNLVVVRESEGSCVAVKKLHKDLEDDAGHKNSLLVVEETVDGLEVSGEQDRVLTGTDEINDDYIENDNTKGINVPMESMTEDKSTRPRSRSLFSHEDLSEATDPKVDLVVNKDANNPNDKPNTSTVDPADNIFSPVDNSSSTLSVPSNFAVDRDNVHIASPRPRSTHRVIRRARSEILSRTTNIRPPLHQIIEEDSVSDFRNPCDSSTSSSPLLRTTSTTTKTPTPKDTDLSRQNSAAVEQGSQDNANGIRQRKVSGGTTDSQGLRGRDGDETVLRGDGNKSPTPTPGANPTPEEQQQKTKNDEENGDQSMWQWLLGCLRRRSTISFILTFAAIFAVALTFLMLNYIR